MGFRFDGRVTVWESEGMRAEMGHVRVCQRTATFARHRPVLVEGGAVVQWRHRSGTAPTVATLSGATDEAYVLWQLGDGRQVIDTGGDPIWEDDPRFAELLATCWTAEDILRQSG